MFLSVFVVTRGIVRGLTGERHCSAVYKMWYTLDRRELGFGSFRPLIELIDEVNFLGCGCWRR